MSDTFQFGLTTAEVKRRFSDVVSEEGSVAKAITYLLNRDKHLTGKYRFQSLAQCEVWDVHLRPGRDSLADLSPALYMLDTYVRFNRHDSRSAALEELLLGDMQLEIDLDKQAIEEACQTDYTLSSLANLPTCHKSIQTESVRAISSFVQAGTSRGDAWTQTDPLPPFGVGHDGNMTYIINAQNMDPRPVRRRRLATQQVAGDLPTSAGPLAPKLSGAVVPELSGSLASKLSGPVAPQLSGPVAPQLPGPNANTLFYRPLMPHGPYTATFRYYPPPIEAMPLTMTNTKPDVPPPLYHKSVRPALILSPNRNLCMTSTQVNDVPKIAKLSDARCSGASGEVALDLAAKSSALIKTKGTFVPAVKACPNSKAIQEKKMVLDSLLYPDGSPMNCKDISYLNENGCSAPNVAETAAVEANSATVSPDNYKVTIESPIDEKFSNARASSSDSTVQNLHLQLTTCRRPAKGRASRQVSTLRPTRRAPPTRTTHSRPRRSALKDNPAPLNIHNGAGVPRTFV